MTYKIEYIATFYADVQRVADFLEEHPQKAARIFAKLDKIFPAFRKITVEDYLAFYTVDNHNGVIEVHRLIYARMDVPRRLSE